MVYYTDFRSIFASVHGSDRIVKVLTVRGAVTNDLLRGGRLLERDNARVVNRCGLHVSRDFIYLPSRD